MSVQITTYNPLLKKAFRDLNVEWISKYFVMEESDYKALDNPEDYIINKGGEILFAIENNIVLGVCALIKMTDPEFDYEMAKMAVSPEAQGKKIGQLLGESIIDKAKELGGKNLYLESNTALIPAISLYYKLGFIKLENRMSPYKRSDIQMAIYF